MNLHPDLKRLLSRFEARRRTLLFARGAFSASTVLVIGVMVAAAFDGPLVFEDKTRLYIAVCLYCAALLVIWFRSGRSLLRANSARELAGALEYTAPELRGALLSAVELGGPVGISGDSQALRALHQERTAKAVASLDCRKLLPWKRLRLEAGALTSAALVLAVVIGIEGERFGRRCLRFLLPASEIDRLSETQITVLSPSPNEGAVPEGEAIEIKVEINGKEALSPSLQFFEANQSGGATKMEATNSKHFSAQLSVASAPLSYRIKAGDGATKLFQLTPTPRPQIKQYVRQYHPPAYTGLPESSDETPGGTIEAVEGTTVDIGFRTNQPVSSGSINLSLGQITETLPLTKDPNDETLLHTNLVLQKSGVYFVRLVSAATTFSSAKEAPQEIHVIVDAPPTISLHVPEQDVVLPLGDKLEFRGTADDDFGLVSVTQQTSLNQGGWHSLEPLAGSGKHFDLKQIWDPLQHHPKVGDIIGVRFVVLDTKGQRAESRVIQISFAPRDFFPQASPALAAQRDITRRVEEAARQANEAARALQEAKAEAESKTTNPLKQNQAIAKAKQALDAAAESAAVARDQVLAEIRREPSLDALADLKAQAQALNRVELGELAPARQALERVAPANADVKPTASELETLRQATDAAARGANLTNSTKEAAQTRQATMEAAALAKTARALAAAQAAIKNQAPLLATSDPRPANQTPSNPTAANATPTNPTPTNPTPTNPTPTNPTAANPTSANPTPPNPTAANATPANPTPSNPTAANSTPANPTPPNPTAANATPTNPTPSNPTAANPTSANPTPPNPTAANSTPANPTPANPTAANSRPANPTPPNPTAANSRPANPTPPNPTAANSTPANPTPPNPTAANSTPASPTPPNPTVANSTPANPTPPNPTAASPKPVNPTPANPTAAKPPQGNSQAQDAAENPNVEGLRRQQVNQTASAELQRDLQALSDHSATAATKLRAPRSALQAAQQAADTALKAAQADIARGQEKGSTEKAITAGDVLAKNLNQVAETLDSLEASLQEAALKARQKLQNEHPRASERLANSSREFEALQNKNQISPPDKNTMAKERLEAEAAVLRADAAVEASRRNASAQTDNDLRTAAAALDAASSADDPVAESRAKTAAIARALQTLEVAASVDEVRKNTEALAKQPTPDRPERSAEAAKREKAALDQLQKLAPEMRRAGLSEAAASAAAKASEEAQRGAREKNRDAFEAAIQSMQTAVSAASEAAQKARTTLKELAPALTERIEKLAAQATAAAQATQKLAANPDPSAPPVPETAIQGEQKFSQKLEDLQKDLQANASAQNSMTAEGRALARDSDAAAAQLKDSGSALKSLKEANASRSEAGSALQRASDQQRQTASKLNQIADHFRNVESGDAEKVAASRQALRGSEQQTGVQEQLEAREKRAAELASLASAPGTDAAAQAKLEALAAAQKGAASEAQAIPSAQSFSAAEAAEAINKALQAMKAGDAQAAAQAAQTAATSQNESDRLARSADSTTANPSKETSAEALPSDSNGLPELARKGTTDWGNLPQRLANDLMEGKREKAPNEYRSAIDAYFQAVAEKARGAKVRP